MVASSQVRAEVGERACVLELASPWSSRATASRQARAAVAARDDTSRPEWRAQRARRAEHAGELELLTGQRVPRRASPPVELRKGGVRSPGNVSRRSREGAGQQVADREEVVERLGGPALLDAQPPARVRIRRQ